MSVMELCLFFNGLEVFGDIILCEDGGMGVFMLEWFMVGFWFDGLVKLMGCSG